MNKGTTCAKFSHLSVPAHKYFLTSWAFILQFILILKGGSDGATETAIDF